MYQSHQKTESEPEHPDFPSLLPAFPVFWSHPGAYNLCHLSAVYLKCKNLYQEQRYDTSPISCSQPNNSLTRITAPHTVVFFFIPHMPVRHRVIIKIRTVIFCFLMLFSYFHFTLLLDPLSLFSISFVLSLPYLADFGNRHRINCIIS